VITRTARGHAPATCATGVARIAAFELYAWRFTPWLMTPRIDGKDG
jgi:uncharacterized protein involved in response to NO